jgi:hypothetical protein
MPLKEQFWSEVLRSDSFGVGPSLLSRQVTGHIWGALCVDSFLQAFCADVDLRNFGAV